MHISIEELIERIELPHNREPCRNILEQNIKLFKKVQGSTNNHQAWEGGYYGHVQEVMNIAVILHDMMNKRRPLPFTLGEAILVLYLHDIEKPWKYDVGNDGQLHHKQELQTKAQAHEFRDQKLLEYGIDLNNEQKNAMRYVEGEFEDYTNRRRVMGPLAAFCHMCDVASARIWFDYPDY